MALVLVVDDSKTARMYCRAVLTSAGHEVMEAADAEDALDRMADRPPDCIVLDLMMPGLSGMDLMEVLGGRGASMPIVVLTASSEEADRLRCQRLGAVAFVNKPASAERLARAVDEALVAAYRRLASGALDDGPG